MGWAQGPEGNSWSAGSVLGQAQETAFKMLPGRRGVSTHRGSKKKMSKQLSFSSLRPFAFQHRC